MFKALNKRLGKKGFTLIELIVVIAIIAILAVILIPRFTGFTRNANIKSAISDTRNILLAVQALNTDGVEITGNNAAMLTQINNFTGMAGKYDGTFGDAGETGEDINSGYFTYTDDYGNYEVTITVRDYQVITSEAAAVVGHVVTDPAT